MKITDVKIPPPLGTANRNWVLVKVFTDEGIVGLGEGAPGLSSEGLKRILVGPGIAAVHMCAAIPNFLALEHHSRNIPLWGQMLTLKHPIEQGYIVVPDGPGLGVELDETALSACLPEGVPLWS